MCRLRIDERDPRSDALGEPRAIPGLAEARPWTNREATTAGEVPERLVVLGGGVIGVELGQAWSSLGSQVAMVEALPRLLPREEPFAAERVEEALAARGIEIRTGVHAAAVRRDEDGVTVELKDGAALSGDELLVAVGRRPATRDLGLKTLGLLAGASLTVDEQLRVPGHGWLYAVGDVNGRSLLTHMGKYQARIAADVILGRAARLKERVQGCPVVTRRLHRPAGRGRGPHARVGEGGGDRRVRSRGSGMRCRRSRRGARSGCGCWRRTACRP